jgi:hypothetical protein
MALFEVHTRDATVSIAILLLASAPVCANDRAVTPEARSPTGMEEQFWTCDYTATTRRVAASEADACVANFEALKKAKFAGDFKALLSWWQENKAAQHAARSRSDRAAAVR